jgi:flagellar basal body-associated protein FliL
MNPAEIIAISVGSITLLAAILGGLLWLIRAQVALQREFKPNGGSSTRDALNRIETDMKDVRRKIDDHVTYHLNNDL